eukprot:353241-Chlamydomonas_euryale.AAC.5
MMSKWQTFQAAGHAATHCCMRRRASQTPGCAACALCWRQESSSRIPGLRGKRATTAALRPMRMHVWQSAERRGREAVAFLHTLSQTPPRRYPAGHVHGQWPAGRLPPPYSPILGCCSAVHVYAHVHAHGHAHAQFCTFTCSWKMASCMPSTIPSLLLGSCRIVRVHMHAHVRVHWQW